MFTSKETLIFITTQEKCDSFKWYPDFKPYQNNKSFNFVSEEFAVERKLIFKDSDDKIINPSKNSFYVKHPYESNIYVQPSFKMIERFEKHRKKYVIDFLKMLNAQSIHFTCSYKNEHSKEYNTIFKASENLSELLEETKKIVMEENPNLIFDRDKWEKAKAFAENHNLLDDNSELQAILESREPRPDANISLSFEFQSHIFENTVKTINLSLDIEKLMDKITEKFSLAKFLPKSFHWDKIQNYLSDVTIHLDGRFFPQKKQD